MFEENSELSVAYAPHYILSGTVAAARPLDVIGIGISAVKLLVRLYQERIPHDN